MTKNLELVVYEDQETALRSIFEDPVVDTSYLVQQWQAARDRFLFYILTKEGMEAENLRHNTKKAYGVALAQFFDGLYDSYGIALWPRIQQPWAITKGHVQRWRLILGLQGKPVYGKVEDPQTGKLKKAEVDRTGLASSSINLKLAALKEFFDFLQHDYELPYQPFLHNPFLQADPPILFEAESDRHVVLWDPGAYNPFNSKSIKRAKVDPYSRSTEPTMDELARIFDQINLDAVGGKRDYALLLAIYATACRASEILNLKWGDLQPTAEGSYMFSFRGKSGKTDRVEMAKEVYDNIVLYLQAAGRLEGIGEDDYVFTRLGDSYKRLPVFKGVDLDPNTPISHDTASGILKKYARRAGVDKKKAHLHALRHAATTQTRIDMEKELGAVDLLTIKHLLRHSNLNTTQIYVDKRPVAANDPWAKSRIDAVRPKAVKRRRKKAVPPQQLPLEAANPAGQAEEIARLRAEVERLKEELAAT